MEKLCPQSWLVSFALKVSVRIGYSMWLLRWEKMTCSVIVMQNVYVLIHGFCVVLLFGTTDVIRPILN